MMVVVVVVDLNEDRSLHHGRIEVFISISADEIIFAFESVAI